MSQLNEHQRKVAGILRLARGEVLPGTNVVIDEAQRMRWYQTVNEAADGLEFDSIGQVTEFMDLAGVPD